MAGSGKPRKGGLRARFKAGVQSVLPSRKKGGADISNPKTIEMFDNPLYKAPEESKPRAAEPLPSAEPASHRIDTKENLYSTAEGVAQEAASTEDDMYATVTEEQRRNVGKVGNDGYAKVNEENKGVHKPNYDERPTLGGAITEGAEGLYTQVERDQQRTVAPPQNTPEGTYENTTSPTLPKKLSEEGKQALASMNSPVGKNPNPRTPPRPKEAAPARPKDKTGKAKITQKIRAQAKKLFEQGAKPGRRSPTSTKTTQGKGPAI